MRVGGFFSLIKTVTIPQRLHQSKQGHCPNWNNGILEYWVLGKWDIGLLFRRRQNNKIKNWVKSFFENQHSSIPQFHYSMNAA